MPRYSASARTWSTSGAGGVSTNSSPSFNLHDDIDVKTRHHVDIALHVGQPKLDFSFLGRRSGFAGIPTGSLSGMTDAGTKRRAS